MWYVNWEQVSDMEQDHYEKEETGCLRCGDMTENILNYGNSWAKLDVTE
jgi:hypothetical protein